MRYPPNQPYPSIHGQIPVLSLVVNLVGLTCIHRCRTYIITYIHATLKVNITCKIRRVVKLYNALVLYSLSQCIIMLTIIKLDEMWLKAMAY